MTLQSSHAGKPAIVVGGFASNVGRDFRVRQHQKGLRSQGFNHGITQGFGLHHAVNGGNTILMSGCHGGSNRLWTERGNV